MEQHVVEGFNPINGREVIDLLCAAVRKVMDESGYFQINLAYAQVEFDGTFDVRLSTSGYGEPEALPPIRVHGAAGKLPEGEGMQVSETPLSFQVSHKVEFPDQSRAELLSSPSKDDGGGMVGVAPTRAGVESYPEKFRSRR